MTAGAVAWMAMNQQQQQYNETLGGTVNQTQQLISLEAELGRMSPMERLQREYAVVRRFYEASADEGKTSERTVSISVGRIEVSTENLGSSLDRERTAAELADQLAKKLALKGVG